MNGFWQPRLIDLLRPHTREQLMHRILSERPHRVLLPDHKLLFRIIKYDTLTLNSIVESTQFPRVSRFGKSRTFSGAAWTADRVDCRQSSGKIAETRALPLASSAEPHSQSNTRATARSGRPWRPRRISSAGGSSLIQTPRARTSELTGRGFWLHESHATGVRTALSAGSKRRFRRTRCCTG